MPLGVFDSGMGGLTVVKALREALPQRDILYVGDTARVPYGNKSAETVLGYCREIVAFLKLRGVERIVAACNTASALAVEELSRTCPVPLMGMIEPGVAAALATGEGPVGVIGTRATIASGAYQKALQQACPGLRVVAQSAPLLVPLVEEGWVDGEITEKVVRNYLDPLLRENIRVLVLACTHYPLLQGVLRRVLGPGVKLVDSSSACARVLQPEESRYEETGALRIYLTDDPGPLLERVKNLLGGEGSVIMERIHLPHV